jgi:hypothetical protein
MSETAAVWVNRTGRRRRPDLPLEALPRDGQIRIVRGHDEHVGLLVGVRDEGEVDDTE